MLLQNTLRGVIASIAAFGSLGLFAITLLADDETSLSGVQVVILIAAGAFIVIDAGLAIRRALDERPKTYKLDEKGRAKINEFMLDWLRSSGRAAIMTRDMSWAESSDDISALLREKAARSELVICMPKPTEFAKSLEALGAELIGAPANPRSRFTIADYGSQGTRVAIGISDGKRHHIELHGGPLDQAYAVTQDLVDALYAQATAQ